jgi:hypothetical protein
VSDDTTEGGNNKDASKAAPRPDFLVKLRPISHRPTRATLGMFLKVLGRYYGLQCRDAIEVPRDDEPIAPPATTKGKEDRA